MYMVETLLFSATFPEQIEERVDRVLSRISVGVPLRVSTSAAIFQRVMPLLDDNEELDIVGDNDDGTASSSLQIDKRSSLSAPPQSKMTYRYCSQNPTWCHSTG
mmetsp:Transcript_19504/g.35305  ORF Transcript_19504/g.35305 Transcript_19504/m.35305 type:complete len:104 (-) Transcript_19504:631-942(-)